MDLSIQKVEYKPVESNWYNINGIAKRSSLKYVGLELAGAIVSPSSKIVEGKQYTQMCLTTFQQYINEEPTDLCIIRCTEAK